MIPEVGAAWQFGGQAEGAAAQLYRATAIVARATNNSTVATRPARMLRSLSRLISTVSSAVAARPLKDFTRRPSFLLVGRSAATASASTRSENTAPINSDVPQRVDENVPGCLACSWAIITTPVTMVRIELTVSSGVVTRLNEVVTSPRMEGSSARSLGVTTKLK